jgi:hypothetical protein
MALNSPQRAISFAHFPLPLCNVEDLLHERGIDICHKKVRFWRNRFGPMFAADSQTGGADARMPALAGGISRRQT